MAGGMSYSGLSAPMGRGEKELTELERVAKMKQAKLKALMYAKYLTMYGGDPATMQGILGSERGYGNYGSFPGPGIRGG